MWICFTYTYIYICIYIYPYCVYIYICKYTVSKNVLVLFIWLKWLFGDARSHTWYYWGYNLHSLLGSQQQGDLQRDRHVGYLAIEEHWKERTVDFPDKYPPAINRGWLGNPTSCFLRTTIRNRGYLSLQKMHGYNTDSRQYVVRAWFLQTTPQCRPSVHPDFFQISETLDDTSSGFSWVLE